MSYGESYHVKEVLNEISAKGAPCWSVRHTLKYKPFQKTFRFNIIYG